jgi:protein involved in polysaccharide export with SLBB domain
MSSVPTQAGQNVIVGFGNYEWDGYIPEDGLTEVTAYENEEEIDDLNGNVRTKIRSGEYTEVSGTVTVDETDPASAIYGIAPGDKISITTPGNVAEDFEVQEWTPTASRLSVKVAFTLRKDEIEY